MNERLLPLQSNPTLQGALLLAPALAIAATPHGGMASFYGFVYGITMAAIGYWLANSWRMNSRALKRFLALALLLPGVVLAATSGSEFQAFYDFIYDAATGYLGRGLAITGGVFGLAYGIGKGSPLPAVLGIVLAIFGMLGPTIVNALFNSATI